MVRIAVLSGARSRLVWSWAHRGRLEDGDVGVSSRLDILGEGLVAVSSWSRASFFRNHQDKSHQISIAAADGTPRVEIVAQLFGQAPNSWLASSAAAFPRLVFRQLRRGRLARLQVPGRASVLCSVGDAASLGAVVMESQRCRQGPCSEGRHRRDAYQRPGRERN